MRLNVSDITCIRGGRLVLQDVSFDLKPGIANILTGPNGSGKSTLLRVVAGLVDHQHGQIKWLDETGGEVDEDETPHTSLFHYVGHLDAVKPSLSVQENLKFWASLYGEKSDLDKALETLGLGGLKDVPGAFLSAGQKKRLSLAKLLLGSRPLWILDEPSVSLDVAGIVVVADLMKAHCEGGGMLLVTTHVDIGLKAAKTGALELSSDGVLHSGLAEVGA
jgi:heme exporter protein A